MSVCLGTMTIATAPGLRVDPPIVLEVRNEHGLWVAYDPMLGRLYAETLYWLLDEASGAVAYLWQAYACADDADLTARERKLAALDRAPTVGGLSWR